MNWINVAVPATYITMVFDGDEKWKALSRGNFLGIYYIPPQGGWEWVAQNGDTGLVDTQDEALREIVEAWER